MRRPPYYKRLAEKARNNPFPDCLRVFAGSLAWDEARQRVNYGQRFVVMPDDMEPDQVNWSMRALSGHGLSTTDAFIFIYGDHPLERTNAIVVAMMEQGFELVIVVHADMRVDPLIYKAKRGEDG